jgi:hypothetical protein
MIAMTMLGENKRKIEQKSRRRCEILFRRGWPGTTTPWGHGSWMMAAFGSFNPIPKLQQLRHSFRELRNGGDTRRFLLRVATTVGGASLASHGNPQSQTCL